MTTKVAGQMTRGVTRYVGSVAELRASSDLSGDVCLQGYYGEGSPGGGHVYVDSSDTTSSDNGVTVFVDAAGNRWKRVPKGFVSLFEAGCIDDADPATLTGTDNYARFVAAIQSGQPVMVDPTDNAFGIDLSANPEITFALNNVTIFGVGPSSKILCFNDSGILKSFFEPSVVDGFTVRNIFVDCGGLVNGTSNVGANMCFAFNPNAPASCKNITIEGVTIERAQDSGIHTRRIVANPTFTTEELKVSDCKFRNVGKHGLGLNNLRHANISDCYMEGMGNPDFGAGDPGGLGFDISRNCRHVNVSNVDVKTAKGIFKVQGELGDPDMMSYDINISNISGENLFEPTAGSSDLYAFKVEADRVSVDQVKVDGLPHEILIDLNGSNISVSKVDLTGATATASPSSYVRIENSNNINVEKVTAENSNLAYGALVINSSSVTIDGIKADSGEAALRILGPSVSGLSFKKSEIRAPNTFSLASGASLSDSNLSENLFYVPAGTAPVGIFNSATANTKIIGNTMVSDSSSGDWLFFANTAGIDHNIIKNNIVQGFDPITLNATNANSIIADNIEY